MDRKQDCSRKSFLRQPARSILVDFSHPLGSVGCHSINESLSNLFTLLNHLQGPPRVPLLSIFALGNFPECLFPLQPIRGNFSRLMLALNELKSLSRSVLTRKLDARDCILDGLKETLTQFSRVSQVTKQDSSNSLSQLEVTLMTSRSEGYIQALVDSFASELDLQHLRKINVMIINISNNLLDDSSLSISGAEEAWESHVAFKENHTLDGMSDLGLSILDITMIDSDTLSLQNALHAWLHDCSTDQEHVHLILPPSSAAAAAAVLGHESDMESGSVWEDHSTATDVTHHREIRIKCDFQERVLDPSVCFDAKLGDPFLLHPFPPASGSSSGRGQLVLPTYQLKVTATVPTGSICESVVFGMPLIMRPTACWKLEWDELESNQQHFHSMCKLLSDKDLGLIARAERVSSPSFSPHFLILPASSCTVLIKSIAPRELILPVDLTSPEETPGPVAQRNMESSLSLLEHWPSYNPLLVQSGFLEMLQSSNKSQRKIAGSLGTRGHQQVDRGGPKFQKAGQPSSKQTIKGGRTGISSAAGTKNLGTSKKSSRVLWK